MATQLHPQLLSHDGTMRKKCYQRDFKKLPNQKSIDIPMQTSKALFVTNSKLSTNAHLVRICPEMGADYQRMHISFEYALRWARKVCSVFQNYKRNNYVMTKCSIIPVLPKRTSSIIWNAIVVQQVMNYTLSSLHFEKCEIVRNTISFHINLFPCYASHRLKQVRCLALEVIIFCLTIVCVWEGLGRGGVLQQ